MASRLPVTLVTARDQDIFLALDRCPLTVRQLLKVSKTFAYPFTSERRVQERLAKLCAAHRVRRWHYATTGPGVISYFTLSPEGYSILHGHDVPLPRSHAFAPVAVARQHHAQALADFIVHTVIAARGAGVALENFHRENALCLAAGGDHLYPDSAFQLLVPNHLPFHFYVELDNATQRVHSDKEMNSWDRKIRLYEAYATHTDRRFRVLVVTTRRSERLDHILSAAAELTQNANRSLFYGIPLAAYLEQADALRAPCFLNHRKQPVGLLAPRGMRPRSSCAGSDLLSGTSPSSGMMTLY